MILGTRGSELALAQTDLVRAELHRRFPLLGATHKVVQTTGDLRQSLRPGSTPDADKSVWTRELEAALADGRIHAAVHSAKDVPADLPPGFQLSACLPRAAVEDVLVSKHPGGIAGLRSRATVATSSIRRIRLLLHERPDLRTHEMRGNVPTRIDKLARQPDLDAVVLARAGLDRLGFATPWSPGGSRPLPPGVEATVLPADRFLPAPAQGIVVIETFGADPERDAVLEGITHRPTWSALRAEREFVRLLGAGCHTPLGMLTRLDRGMIHLSAIVFPDDRQCQDPPRSARAAGPAEAPELVAAELVRSLA